MDEATAALFDQTATTANAVARELNAAALSLDAAAKKLEALATVIRAELAQPIPPPPGPMPDDVLLEPATGLTFSHGTGHPQDREKIAALFRIPPAVNGGKLGYWADVSQSLAVAADGSFGVVFDKARRTAAPNSGGSSWVNACVPLARPVTAARLSMTVRFGSPGRFPWGWGISGKLPGLQTWTENQTPGGGQVTPRNHSTRICWSDWDKNGKAIRIGPYIYGQHTADVPEQIWAAPASSGTVRWGGPVVPALEANPAGPHLIELEMWPDSRPGWARVVQRINGNVIWDHAVQVLGSSVPFKLTHVPFCFMYGGDTLEYGPAEKVTAIEVSDFHVVEL